MSRFNFDLDTGPFAGPIADYEPSGLADMYEVLKDAQNSIQAYSYYVPSALQTEGYAGELLRSMDEGELAEARIAIRIHREHILAAAHVPRVAYLGAAALWSPESWFSRGVMLDQIDHIRTAVEADIEAEPKKSRLRVGLVPTELIKPLPNDVPPVTTLAPRDVRSVETKDGGTFILTNDDLSVDHVGRPGPRGAQALRNQARLGEWESMAVFGEDALTILEERRTALLAEPS